VGSNNIRSNPGVCVRIFRGDASMKNTFSFSRLYQVAAWRWLPILSGAALLVGTIPCWAADTSPMTDSQKTFVGQYVQATQGRDFEKYKRLLHPNCMACIDKDNEDYHQDQLYLKHWTKTQDFQAKVQALPPEQGEYYTKVCPIPLKPTHFIQLDLSPGQFESKTIIINIAFKNGSWYEVISVCRPTPETLQKFRAAIARAEALFSSLKEPLRSELKALLRQGEEVSAIRKYRKASGEDTWTAMRVITLLDKSL